MRIAIGLAIVAGLVAAARVLPVQQWLLAFVGWIRGAGGLGMFAFAVAYVLACVLFLPGSILTLGAGFAYGVGLGVPLVWASANVGAALAFVLGRTVARDVIARRIAGNEKFAAIDRAVGRQGFRIVLLTRLSPVFPFNLLNYAFGLTRVAFRDYVLGSMIGMLPGTVMYVYLGSLVTGLAELAGGQSSGGTAKQVFYFVGLAATVAVTLYVTRVARRALAEATAVAARRRPGRTRRDGASRRRPPRPAGRRAQPRAAPSRAPERPAESDAERALQPRGHRRRHGRPRVGRGRRRPRREGRARRAASPRGRLPEHGLRPVEGPARRRTRGGARPSGAARSASARATCPSTSPR